MTTQQTVLPPHIVPVSVRRITRAEATQEPRVDSLESFEIGGTAQWVLLRGNPLAGRVLLIVQQHDFATPPDLVARYVDDLDAPRGKSLVWFEASAHMPHYEEPVRFREPFSAHSTS